MLIFCQLLVILFFSFICKSNPSVIFQVGLLMFMLFVFYLITFCIIWDLIISDFLDIYNFVYFYFKVSSVHLIKVSIVFSNYLIDISKHWKKYMDGNVSTFRTLKAYLHLCLQFNFQINVIAFFKWMLIFIPVFELFPI